MEVNESIRTVKIRSYLAYRLRLANTLGSPDERYDIVLKEDRKSLLEVLDVHELLLSLSDYSFAVTSALVNIFFSIEYTKGYYLV